MHLGVQTTVTRFVDVPSQQVVAEVSLPSWAIPSPEAIVLGLLKRGQSQPSLQIATLPNRGHSPLVFSLSALNSRWRFHHQAQSTDFKNVQPANLRR